MKSQDQFEIRNYSGMTVVKTHMNQGEDRGDGFRRLFRYISGDNESQQKIAMTTPVFVETADGREEAMQFVVPADVAAQGAPAPMGEAVKLEQIAGGSFGVLRFKGSKDPQARALALATLQSRLTALGYETTGDPIYAYYDPPWTPEALRRNEVLLRIR